jgi:hypothetical protein
MNQRLYWLKAAQERFEHLRVLEHLEQLTRILVLHEADILANKDFDLQVGSQTATLDIVKIVFGLPKG